MASKDAASLRKRAQITKANKMMFVWVACASVIVSVSAVITIMVIQKGLHNQKAIGRLNETVKTLERNNERVPELENQLRALGSNQALLDLRNNDTDNALRVILDALPADPNPSALGASLQNRLFEGVTIENLQVDPAGVDNEASFDTVEGSEESDRVASDDQIKAQPISFQFVVQGSPAQLKELLTQLERSIRTIQVDSLKIESGADSRQTLSVEGTAYYLPAKILELRNEEVQQ